MHFSFTSAYMLYQSVQQRRWGSGVHCMLRAHNTGLKLKYLYRECSLASGRQRKSDAIDARQKGKYHRSLSSPSYPTQTNGWNATGNQWCIHVFSALSVEFKVAANQMKEAKQPSRIFEKKTTHTQTEPSMRQCVCWAFQWFQWRNRLFDLRLYRTATQFSYNTIMSPSLFAIRLRVPHTWHRIYM